MAEFIDAFNFVLPHEGGYVCDKDDPGGETKYGICKASYPKVDIKKLTLDDARAIYERDYWLPIYSQIISQRVANKVFDMSVNMGHTQSHKILQSACVENGFKLEVDGKFGRKTLEAVNLADPDFLIDSIKYFARRFYMELAAEKPQMEKFLNGWIKRADA